MTEVRTVHIEEVAEQFTERANRLLKLIKLNAPPIIISSEINLIQDALRNIDLLRGDHEAFKKDRENSPVKPETMN